MEDKENMNNRTENGKDTETGKQKGNRTEKKADTKPGKQTENLPENRPEAQAGENPGKPEKQKKPGKPEGKGMRSLTDDGEKQKQTRSGISFFKNNIETIAVLAISFTLSFNLLLTCSFNVWKWGNLGNDNAVFRTVAYMMRRGYMPYRDTFDHKGPLIYILNYVGLYIDDRSGIWWIELVFMTLLFFVLYRIARLVGCRIVTAAVAVLTATALLFNALQGGNLTEEFSMLFIAVSIYIFADYFKNDRISKARLMVCGFCCCAVMFLRINMCTVWLVFALVVVGQQIARRDFDKLKYFTMWFIAGLLVLLLPVLIWFGEGVLRSFWECYIEFNGKYVKSGGGKAVFRNKWNAFFTFFNSTPFLIAFLCQIHHCITRKKLFDYAYMVYLFLSLVFLCISGRTYGHYGMILVPTIVYPVAMMLKELQEISIKEVRTSLTAVVCIFLMFSVILPDWAAQTAKVPEIYDNRENDQRSWLTKKVADIIKENTGEDEPISVYGNWDAIYVAAERPHATRYSYQFPIGTISRAVMLEYLDQMRQELPRILVIQEGYYNDDIKGFIEENHYSSIWEEDKQKKSMVFLREDSE